MLGVAGVLAQDLGSSVGLPAASSVTWYTAGAFDYSSFAPTSGLIANAIFFTGFAEFRRYQVLLNTPFTHKMYTSYSLLTAGGFFYKILF